MDDATRSALLNLLTAYFGDASTEEGVRGLVFVTRTNPDSHRDYTAALEAGLAAARQGDPELVTGMRRNFTPFLRDAAEAEQLLAEILDAYRAAYAAATG